MVEVCLAILVVGLGLLALFGLFPGGLRSSEAAVGDTACALFAENIIAGVSANASTITSWATWSNDGSFASVVLSDLVESQPIVQTGLSGGERAIMFPPGSDYWIRYRLSLTNEPGIDRRLRYITVHVAPGRYGGFLTNRIERFHSEMYFTGM